MRYVLHGAMKQSDQCSMFAPNSKFGNLIDRDDEDHSNRSNFQCCPQESRGCKRPWMVPSGERQTANVFASTAAAAACGGEYFRGCSTQSVRQCWQSHEDKLATKCRNPTSVGSRKLVSRCSDLTCPAAASA